MKAKKTRAVAKRTAIEFPFSVLGDNPRTVRVNDGTTLEQIREKLNLKGLTVKVNGEKVSETHILRAGDQVVAVPQVKGGYIEV